jgi:hypothetical protein
VIRAFNDDKPYDQFVVEQVAGDLLPPPPRPPASPLNRPIVGTGFLRCGVTTGEGGSIVEENLYRYAVERTNTVGEAFLGLTLGCAVCHDHKFDPISAKEYYSLYAFFNSAADPGMDGNVLLTPPTVRLSTPEQERRLAELDAKIAPLQRRMDVRVRTAVYLDPGDAGSRAVDPRFSFVAWWKARAGRDTPGLAPELNAIRKAGPTKRPSAEKRRKLRDYYLTNVYPPTRTAWAAEVKELAAARAARDELEKQIPQTFVFRDLPKPRASFVMTRGQYNKPAEPVEPNTPAFLPPLRAEHSGLKTRLDLARWLVSPEQPLTPRVAVNRFWQQVFGTGIVKTSNDFGSQGEAPSHPALLDWLAADFREHGWDVKRLVRQMVCSRAFRQTAATTAELRQRDPANRLLARGPRVRLDAEQIRDNALAVSGLINLEMGGRASKPYQPPNIWEPVAFTGSNTRSYSADKGPGLYRRSVYCFLKRTAPPPYMSNFDAPSREASCSRRDRSDTPLQALQLMNDTQHVEAARGLAERMMTAGGSDVGGRLAYGYRAVLARAPDAGERAVLAEALATFAAKYRKDPAAAKQLVHQGESTPDSKLSEPELAAYTLLANLILNLDETVNRN